MKKYLLSVFLITSLCFSLNAEIEWKDSSQCLVETWQLQRSTSDPDAEINESGTGLWEDIEELKEYLGITKNTNLEEFLERFMINCSWEPFSKTTSFTYKGFTVQKISYGERWGIGITIYKKMPKGTYTAKYMIPDNIITTAREWRKQYPDAVMNLDDPEK
ncbi:MAG: hypothetical protein J5687_01235 [Treponema sp.]|nr:hypothetical protein [Treponema sp.]